MTEGPGAYLWRPVLIASLLLLAGPGRVFAESGGADVNIIVREVRVAPILAHVGDVIRIDMVWEYWGELHSHYYETTDAQVEANGKVVASVPFTYDYGQHLGDRYRQTFFWDTAGADPGEYRIRGRVPLSLDVSPFDNFLTVKQPLVLLPSGLQAPEGQRAGGAGVATNAYLFDEDGRAGSR